MVLVFDLGTSALKGGLFGTDGALAARAETPLRLEKSSDPLHHEADASSWVSALTEVSSHLGVEREKGIEAVVVSGNGPTLVPADEAGNPLDLAMTWLDRRGIAEAELISRVSGSYVDPSFYLPKAYWIYRNKPEVYEKTKSFFPCPEFIDFFLTGNRFAILPAPQFTRYIWTAELIEKLGMDPEKFPPFIKPGEMMGKVRKEAEEVSGIPEGVPVFAGGPDFIMSLLGTATIVPGRACDRAGTSEGINLCSANPVQDRRLLCLPHIIAEYHNISGIISTSGKALEWFKNITGREKEGYDSIFKEIGRVPPGSGRLLFLPYLTGERAPLWDPLARGSFLGLTLSHGRKEMTRAVVESVGYAVRDVIEIMEENDCIIEELRITGSQARSPLWNQIKADITGKRILAPVIKDSELVGDLCLGLFSLGRYGSLKEASDDIVKIEKVFSPRVELMSLYDDLFLIYRESYGRLKDVFRSLSEIGGA